MNSHAYMLAIQQQTCASHYEHALELARRACASFPYIAEFFYQCSLLHAVLGQKREAALAADSAIQLAPRKPEYLIHRAIVLLAYNNAESALEDIRIALEEAPNSVNARALLRLCEIISLRKPACIVE